MMRVLVTGGNTVVPIDRVRCISNVFRGRTGANIVQLRLVRGGGHDALHFAFERHVPKATLLQVMAELRAIEGVQEIRV